MTQRSKSDCGNSRCSSGPIIVTMNGLCGGLVVARIALSLESTFAAGLMKGIGRVTRSTPARSSANGLDGHVTALPDRHVSISRRTSHPRVSGQSVSEATSGCRSECDRIVQLGDGSRSPEAVPLATFPRKS